MPPVGSASATGGSATTLAATYSPTNGNYVLVYAVQATGSTATITSVKDNNNVTLTAWKTNNIQAGIFSGIYVYQATGSPTSFTMTVGQTPNGMGIIVEEWASSGMNGVADGTPGAAESTATPLSATYSSSASGEVLVTFGADEGVAATLSLPAGYTADAHNINTSSNANTVVGYKTSTGGSEANSWTQNGSGSPWNVITGAFQAGGGGATSAALARPVDAAWAILHQHGLDAFWQPRSPSLPPPATLQGSAVGFSAGKPVAGSGTVNLGAAVAQPSRGAATASPIVTVPAIPPGPIPPQFILAQYGLILPVPLTQQTVVVTLQGSGTVASRGAAAAAGTVTNEGNAKLTSRGAAVAAATVINKGAGSQTSRGAARSAATGSSLGSGSQTSRGAAVSAATPATTKAGSGVVTSRGAAVAAATVINKGAGSQTSRGAARAAVTGTSLGSGSQTSRGAAASNATPGGVRLGSGVVTSRGAAVAAGTVINTGAARLTSRGAAVAAATVVNKGSASSSSRSIAKASIGSLILNGTANLASRGRAVAAGGVINLGGGSVVSRGSALSAETGINFGHALSGARGLATAVATVIGPNPVPPNPIPPEFILAQYGLDLWILQPRPLVAVGDPVGALSGGVSRSSSLAGGSDSRYVLSGGADRTGGSSG